MRKIVKMRNGPAPLVYIDVELERFIVVGKLFDRVVGLSDAHLRELLEVVYEMETEEERPS